jgi:hypothetical protein
LLYLPFLSALPPPCFLRRRDVTTSIR